VRWDELFADLDGQLLAAEAAQRDAEIADRTRREAGRLQLLDRLRGARHAELVIAVDGAGVLTGRLVEVGSDWLLLQRAGSQPGREWLVRLAAVLWLRGLGSDSAVAESDGLVAARLDLRYALRALARDRWPVVLGLVDGTLISGTIERVGADFVELIEHPVGEVRRTGERRLTSSVPLRALAVAWRS